MCNFFAIGKNKVIRLPQLCQEFLSLILTGIERLAEFTERYEEFESQRQELANAEKLFDLSITAYPNMVSIDSQLSRLRVIYDLYVDQKVGDGLTSERGLLNETVLSY